MRAAAARVCLGLSLALLLSPLASAAEPVDHAMVAKIRAEAFQRSQVMETLRGLTEGIGPRLTNSPAMAEANRWTADRLRGWGLANVHQEPVEDFGRGWEFSSASVEMVSPRRMPMHALPKAWTPGTNGTVEGEVVIAKLDSMKALEEQRGKLRGKILLLSDARDYKPGTNPDFHRHDDASLGDLQQSTVPPDRPAADRAQDTRRWQERMALQQAVNRFLEEEGVLAVIGISGWDNGIIRVGGGGSRRAGEPVGVTDLAMISTHYNTLMRAVQRGQTPRLRINVDARFTDDANQPAYNTIAELPGGNRRDEIVMLGAHLDSWHTGTGASDNAAGVAVMMEAMRILKAVGAQPRRTIRLGLWTAEEQGLIGSAAHVARHYAAHPEPTDPAQRALPERLREPTGPLRRTRDHERFSVYFNMDNGSGRIRGIYAQENFAAMPIFEAWLRPFHDIGATTVATRNTGSTDHIPFDRVGLPGFQFIQDRLDYFTNVHHSHLDTLDHVPPEDLKQAAAIIATFAWHAATRDEKMPRKPLVDEQG
ncbi:MAG: M20/M25/M40 family metallo-hydrolase [Pseudoxanthomonas suwonensis]|nr:M20/M25/M40 family metallo-hydrolase [Pseudoxanthomonas suwonensis]